MRVNLPNNSKGAIQDTNNKSRTIGGLGQQYGRNQGCGYESLRFILIEKVETGKHEQENVCIKAC
jgi:hypothetical protein